MSPNERLLAIALFWLDQHGPAMSREQAKAGLRLEWESTTRGLTNDLNRLLDLARYCRSTLLDDGLITGEEFAKLTAHDPDRGREMESFPALMRRLEEAEAKSLEGVIVALKRLRDAVLPEVKHEAALPAEEAFVDALARLAAVVAPVSTKGERIDGKTVLAQWRAATGTPVPENLLDPKAILSNKVGGQ